MDNLKEALSSSGPATPITKRIGVICLTAISVAALVTTGLGEVAFKDALLIIIPCLTSISAMIDGGK